MQYNISCFVIENESFIEVRDCCIRSINDKQSFDSELDNFYKTGKDGGQSQNNTIDTSRRGFLELIRKKDDEIKDCCFSMNQPSIRDPRGTVVKSTGTYRGLVSLQSTTIT